MPPKPKYTREEIIDAAFEIARTEGIDAVVARNIAKKLGTSSSPIFTFFSGIDEVKDAVLQKTAAFYRERSLPVKQYNIAFKQFGIEFIRFAKEEPKLFQLLFVHESNNSRNFVDYFDVISDLREMCVTIIRDFNDISRTDAERTFDQVWIYAFGVAVLCANNVCTFTDEEIISMLGQQFDAVMLVLKEGNKSRWEIVPQRLKS